MPASVARAIEEPTTLTIPRTVAPAFLGLLDRRQRVGGLAGLADGDHDRAVVDDRIAVAELAGVLRLGRDAGQVFEEELADQAGVERRAAGREDDVLGLRQLAQMVGDAAQHDLAALLVDPPAQAGAERFRLLEDLLEHVVLEAAQLDLLERELDLLEVLGHDDVVDGLGMEPIRADHDHLVVGQVDRLGRVLDDGGGVGGQDVLVVADAEDQRAAPLGADERIREVGAEDRQPEGPVQPLQGLLDGPFEPVLSVASRPTGSSLQ